MRHDELDGIGERLARIRGQRSQADFAQEAGIHKNTLGTYERAEREMGALPLIRLVRRGWNANWLLTGEGPERTDSPAAAASQAVRLGRDNVQTAAEAVAAALDIFDLTAPPSRTAAAVVALAAELDRRAQAKASVTDLLKRARDLLTRSTDDE